MPTRILTTAFLSRSGVDFGRRRRGADVPLGMGGGGGGGIVQGGRGGGGGGGWNLWAQLLGGVFSSFTCCGLRRDRLAASRLEKRTPFASGGQNVNRDGTMALKSQITKASTLMF